MVKSKKSENMKKNVPGARESSAGDDFHLLWAARKSLELLLPGAQLRALGIEGPAKEETAKLDPQGDKLLAIDLSEYYGGETFTSAKRLVISQLKYSTRRQNETWTAARLSVIGKEKKHSIISRLCDSFKRYYEKYGREQVLQKLVIKLVSNRRASEKLLLAIESSQEFLKGRSRQVYTKTLFKALNVSGREEMRRLQEAAGLGSVEFTDFLRVLDLSDCGEGSRFGQRIDLIKELGQHGGGDLWKQYYDLKGRIWNKMMPEASNEPPLTRHDLLPVFGLSTYRQAFPAEPHFEILVKALVRSEAKKLAELLVNTADRPVCLHAGAGRGKTTLLHMLEQNLPAHSVVVVFDCYGGGTYRNPADVRHAPQRAITQISNELAGRTGSPLLLSIPPSREDILREFFARLDTALLLLRKSNENALIVLAIDAAENSVYAAQERGERSFVHDLLAQPLPKGVRLLVTCRSQSSNILGLPAHQEFQLEGFASGESGRHLKLYFPEADEEQCREFHDLTKGIPRLQKYLLEGLPESIDAVLRPLRPHGTTLSAVFAERIRVAGERLGVPEKVRKICSVLITLPRPVPSRYVAKLSDCTPGTIKDFCVDVGFGLLVDDDDDISFRDQDFEDFLRSQVEEEEAVLKSISGQLYYDRKHDKYAASHLHHFLGQTARYAELRNLILEEELPPVITDHVERQELMLQRIKTAIKIGSHEKDSAGLMKLIFVAAETSKADAAVRNLIAEHYDLAEKFGDPQTVQRLHLYESKSDWPLPTLYRNAAVLARYGSMRERARENLREARGWLNWRDKQPRDSWHDYEIREEDIAAATEAILRIDGPEMAARWLSSWTPRFVIYNGTRLVAASILRMDGYKKLKEQLSKLSLRADLCLAIVQSCVEANVPTPPDIIKKSVRIWHRFARMGRRADKVLSVAGIALCEVAVAYPDLRDLLAAIMTLFSPQLPKHAPHVYSGNYKEIDALLKAHIFTAKLKGESPTWEMFLPEELRRDEKDLSYQEKEKLGRDKRDYRLVYGFLWSSYDLRCDVLLGIVDKEGSEGSFQTILAGLERDYEMSQRHDAGTLCRLLAMALADAAVMIANSPGEWLDKIEGEILKKHRAQINLLRIRLAEKALGRSETHPEALRLIDKVRADLDEYPETAKEQIDFLILCCRIADQIDPKAARHYFQLAINAASEVDEEAFAHIYYLSALAGKAAEKSGYGNPYLAYGFARFVEECSIRLYGWDHFPWEYVVQAITSLDPSSGFAILSRWDDRGVLELGDEIYTLLQVAADRGFISPQAAFSLGILAAPYDHRFSNFAKSLLRLAHHQSGRAGVVPILSMASEDIQLHAPIDERKGRASAIADWAQEFGYAADEGAKTLRNLSAFLDRLEPSKTYEQRVSRKQDKDAQPDWEVILGTRTFLSAEEIEVAITQVKGFDKYGNETILELLKRIQERCAPKDYSSHLDALLRIHHDVLPDSMLLGILEKRLEAWKFHPEVQLWPWKNREEYLKRRFGELFFSESFLSRTFMLFRKVFEVTDKEVFGLVLSVLPDWLDVPAQAIYDVGKEIIASLDPTDADQVLKWELDRLNARLKDNRADGPWDVELEPPRILGETLTAFFWALLGHPDKRMRWRTAHAIRRILKMGQRETVAALLARMEDKSCPVFRDKTHRFFWLSARLWLLIILDRLANEDPELLKPHGRMIAEAAVKPTVPHALMQQFAKSTAVTLHNKYPELFNQLEIELLDAVNKSPFAQVKKDKEQARPKEPENGRFWFNSFDTLPYWYHPLAGC